MADDPKNYFFGHAHSTNKLSDDLNNDPTIKNVLKGICGGDGTIAYFKMVDGFSSMLGSLGKSDKLSGWNKAEMEDGTTSFYQKTTDGKNDYTVTIQAKNFNVDDKGHIQPNDTKVEIEGQTFNGIGHVAANMLINDSVITEMLWEVGTCAAGDLAWKVVSKVIQGIIDNAATEVTKSMGKLVKGPGGALKIEEWAAAEEEAAGMAIKSKSGFRTFLKRIGKPGPIAQLLIIAAFLIALSFILHESYHRVRMWNLTRYKLLWDNTANLHFFEGKIQDGPFSSADGKPSPLGPVCASAPLPGAKKSKQAHFGDFNIVSDSQLHGIGWAMRIKFVNPQDDNDVKYTCCIMFDIPFTGENSTSVTFDTINNLKEWYDGQEGVHRELHVEAKSGDGEITATTSYDYLEGKHPVPSSSGTTKEAYFYQSVISFVETNIASKELPECSPVAKD